MGINLWSLFDRVATAVSDQEAVVWRERRLTYGDVLDRSRRFANVLAAHGIGHRRDRSGLAGWESGQDMVGLYLLNGPEYLIGTMGAYGGRAAPFNVNYRYVADELAYLLDDADAAALVYHARFAPVLAEVLPRLRRAPLLLQVADDSGETLLAGALDFESALDAASAAPPALDHDADDLYVLYTGGTTGMPKGTLWRQGDIFDAVFALPGVTTRDLDELTAIAASGATMQRLVPNAPFMHGAAHWLAVRALLTGHVVVINGVVDRLDPVDTWELVEREHATMMLMVGEAMARPLVAELDAGDHDVSSLTAVVVGGATTSPETKARLLAHLPSGALVADSAGASETGGALQSVSVAGATAELAVFSAGPNVAILDADLTRVLDPREDEIGWFATRGAVPLGYLGDERKTNDTFPTIAGERWSVPGDRARWRPDGTVELLGRDSVTINSGGEKIFAEEVEQALIRHPAVADVIVVGRPSERWGSEVVAVVELAVGADASDDELRGAAAERLARYKLPKAIVRVPSIVRSPAGKADYRWARGVAGGAAGAEATGAPS